MVPFVDLKAQYANIRDEVNAAIQRVLETCQFTLGSEVKAFEEEFAAYCQAKYGIGVNTGTSALHLALLAAGVGANDEVITVPFTFVATVAAISYVGAKPVFVDIDPQSYTMDVNLIEATVTQRTKAILPVHLYGQPADMGPIMELGKKYGLVVIEDACQAHGAEYKGRRVGSIGDMGCFSFYPGKNLGAYGEGGMVVTDNPEFTRTIRMLRDWGAERKYEHVLKGYNYRMEGIQGAVLRVKLRHLDAWTEARRAHASRYRDLLADSGVSLLTEMAYARHVYHVYAIRVRQRAEVQLALLDKGVQTSIHYPIPVHLLPAYAYLGHKTGDFSNSEAVAREELSLPMYAEMTAKQCDQVALAIKELHDFNA